MCQPEELTQNIFALKRERAFNCDYDENLTQLSVPAMTSHFARSFEV